MTRKFFVINYANFSILGDVWREGDDKSEREREREREKEKIGGEIQI